MVLLLHYSHWHISSGIPNDRYRLQCSTPNRMQLTCYKPSFFWRTVIAWNHLDNNTVHSDSTECVKSALASAKRWLHTWSRRTSIPIMFLDASEACYWKEKKKTVKAWDTTKPTESRNFIHFEFVYVGRGFLGLLSFLDKLC